MDLTKLSNDDLIALKENRIKDISDNGLLILAGKEPTQEKPKKPSKYEYDAASVGQPTDEEMAGGAEAQAEFRQVGGQALKNLPGSTYNLGKNLVQAIASPVDTVTNIVQLGYGVLQAIDPTGVLPKDEKSSQIAKQVGDFYVQRYGSVEGAKKAIAEDPAGVLADISSVLYGGGAALRGVGTIGSKTKLPLIKNVSEAVKDVGTSLQKSGQITDPLLQSVRAVGSVGKAAGNVAPQILGLTTGAGSESFRQAYQAGLQGGEKSKQFRENISGRADPTTIVEAAKQNLDSMRASRSDAYRSGQVDISKDKTILSFDGIDKSIVDAEKRVKFGDKVKDEATYEIIQQAKTKIDDWKNSDPNIYHTPEGLDALKQSIGALLDGLDVNKNPYNTINSIYNSVKSEIVKQAPVYAKTMKEYTDATEQIREVEKALSLKDKTSIDTSMRKLMSLMRDNVQTNYGQRFKLGQELEKAGGKPIMPGVAGQALKTLVPRGLQAGATVPTGYLSYLVGGPAATGVSLLSSSPRIMGEAAYGTGVTARATGAAARKVPFALNPELYNLLLQSQNIQE